MTEKRDWEIDPTFTNRKFHDTSPRLKVAHRTNVVFSMKLSPDYISDTHPNIQEQITKGYSFKYTRTSVKNYIMILMTVYVHSCMHTNKQKVSPCRA